MPRSSTLAAALALAALVRPALSGNTTCAGNALDWYTSAVGETPCTTYQRLRQICNSEYEVPSFRPNTPGDNCDDQLSSCCCNSISFALSMLCMNCQWDVNGGSVNGIDAGNGAYYMYRFSDYNGQYCGDGTNQSLPTTIQTAVCNQGIKLDDFMYNLFWNTGAWFYTYTREAAQQDQATDNNDTFTHCANAATSSKPSSTSTSTSTSTAPAAPTSTDPASPAPSSSPGTTPPGSSSPAEPTSSNPSSPAPGTGSSAGRSTSTPPPSSVATTVETRTTVSGIVTSVALVTTIAAPHVSSSSASAGASVTAIGLGATNGGRKMSMGAVVGGAVGGAVGLVALLVVAAVCVRRRRRAVSAGAGAGGIEPAMAAVAAGDRYSVSPFMPRPSTDDVFAYRPRATEKLARMQRNHAGSGSGSGGTRDSSAFGSGSEPGTARTMTGPPTESAGSEVGLLDSRDMLLQEEDAGRIAGGIRLPPAYRSEWGDE